MTATALLLKVFETMRKERHIIMKQQCRECRKNQRLRLADKILGKSLNNGHLASECFIYRHFGAFVFSREIEMRCGFEMRSIYSTEEILVEIPVKFSILFPYGKVPMTGW